MPAKRQNLANDSTSDKHGALFKSLGQVKVEGRSIIELFTEIPDANMYPDYRDVVKSPVSLAEIGKRVKKGAYANDQDLLDDFELMAENAKAYNGEESPVYDDAVDILDFALLYLGRNISRASRARLQNAALTELESYKSKGRKLSDAFIVEPDTKTYPNYLAIVKNPTSFTKVRKQLETNGCWESWADFEEAVGLIFRNAMLYNQEDSQIYNDAKALSRQLENKIKKYSQIPHYLETALPRAASTGPSESGTGDDDDEEDDNGDDEGDDEDDDEKDLPVRAPRYEDDDDEDFEADSEDMDDEDLGEGEGQEGGMHLENGAMIPGAGPLPPQFFQPSAVYDELVYRPPDEGPEDALLRMVTCHSTPIPPHLAVSLPIEDVKRAENDTLQIKIPPSPSKAFTSYATTLPYYQSTLRLSVLPNRQIEHLQLAVLLNGAKLLPLPAQFPQRQWESFEITLAPGLNQLTIIAIKPTFGGFVRQYGPPPLADAEPDEERMVLFLNLSK